MHCARPSATTARRVMAEAPSRAAAGLARRRAGATDRDGDGQRLGAAAATGPGCLPAVERADTRLGQHELDAARRLPIAGDRAHDRSRLLVAGEQEERRRAAVAL